MQDIDLSKLKPHELEELQFAIERQLFNNKYDEWKNTKHTKEQIIAMFNRFGYTVPKGAVIWRVHPRGERQLGGYGMEVGSYDHSCYIDSSTYKVLLVVAGTDHYVESFSDLWLSDPITV